MNEDLKYGWQCPACKVIYSPVVEACGCEAELSNIELGEWKLYANGFFNELDYELDYGVFGNTTRK